MTASINRRTALAGISFAGSTALLPIACASIAKASTVDRAAWDQALATYRKARSNYEIANDRFDKCAAVYEAAKPSPDLIDWKEITFVTPHSSQKERIARTLDLDSEWEQFLSLEGKTWWAKDVDAAKARHWTALETVREYRRLDEQARKSTGFHDICEVIDDISDAEAEAEKTLLHTPAPDHPALLFKLERLFGAASMENADRDSGGHCTAWSWSYIEPVMADAARLLAGEA